VKSYAPIFQYRENRYRKGGTSGAGSIWENRKWKWGIIERYVGNLDDVLDVGCGDLSFWEGRDCSKYLGLDIFPTIIEKDRQLRPSWQFKVHQAEVPLDVHARIVLCMDLLFHMNGRETLSLCERPCVGLSGSSGIMKFPMYVNT